MAHRRPSPRFDSMLTPRCGADPNPFASRSERLFRHNFFAKASLPVLGLLLRRGPRRGVSFCLGRGPASERRPTSDLAYDPRQPFEMGPPLALTSGRACKGGKLI